MIFLKGYQWPFDTDKIAGSSIIDILVHHEIFHKGNRVYMDFRTDPTGLKKGFSSLSEEAFSYLERSGALLETPIARLEKMNPQAIQLYASHGIDLYTEPLEIAVCAQHSNGGLAVDLNWQSTIKGLYVAGEAAGTFGIARPGGSALNSTQVGSQRAAEHIAFTRKLAMPSEIPTESDMETAKRVEKEISQLLSGKGKSLLDQRKHFQSKMSLYAAHIRDAKAMEALEAELKEAFQIFFTENQARNPRELGLAFKNRICCWSSWRCCPPCSFLGKTAAVGDRL